jgi:hypothetical protein
VLSSVRLPISLRVYCGSIMLYICEAARIVRDAWRRIFGRQRTGRLEISRPVRSWFMPLKRRVEAWLAQSKASREKTSHTPALYSNPLRYAKSARTLVAIVDIWIFLATFAFQRAGLAYRNTAPVRVILDCAAALALQSRRPALQSHGASIRAWRAVLHHFFVRRRWWRRGRRPWWRRRDRACALGGALLQKFLLFLSSGQQRLPAQAQLNLLLLSYCGIRTQQREATHAGAGGQHPQDAAAVPRLRERTDDSVEPLTFHNSLHPRSITRRRDVGANSRIGNGRILHRVRAKDIRNITDFPCASRKKYGHLAALGHMGANPDTMPRGIT